MIDFDLLIKALFIFVFVSWLFAGGYIIYLARRNKRGEKE